MIGVKMPKLKCWERIGDVAKPRYQGMWGKKDKQDVVWIDNWNSNNFAVIVGKEIRPSTYKEKSAYVNVTNKKDAVEQLKRYLKDHDTC